MANDDALEPKGGGRIEGGVDAVVVGPSLDGLGAAALLANAYEELGQFGEASEAYVRAADETPYSLTEAQYLLEAGRTAALNQNPDRAAELFERIIDDNEGEPVAQEARLRLGEVRPGGNA